MTKISIIVPFHNVENYISKCLSSLMSQTLKDIEIICINDASTDNSKDIVLNYIEKDKRILLLETDEMSGQSYARNLGMQLATGEYVGFVDSDDWVALDMFEKMYNKAKQDDVDITMCQAELYDDKTQEVYTDDYYSLKPLENYKDRVFNAVDTKNSILDINVVLWNKIYKKSFIDTIGAKFADGYIYEDMLFFFETYLKAQKINILWEKLYSYRQNRVFSTMQKSDKKVYDRIPMVERTYNVLKQAPFFEEKKIDISSWIIDDIFHRYTLLEPQYYENYYSLMRDFFLKIEFNNYDEIKYSSCYAREEFLAILDRDYFEFWNFLIEKYKTTNKQLRKTEDIYNKKLEQQEKEIVSWWKNYSEENTKQEVQRRLDEQYTFLESKKQYEMGLVYDEFNEKLSKQEYELKRWQAESVRQKEEQLTNEYKWKLQQQKQYYVDSLYEQKQYYENHYLLVKILLKSYKKLDQLKNKINKILKKN